jgi:NitT/TauT family transport system ATP-binding protein
MTTIVPALDLQGIAKSFQTRTGTSVQALAPLSATVAEGEFVTVIGPSGCGKTTLLRMVCGLESPSRGRAVVNGDLVRGPRRDIGVVFQQPELLEWRTVIENITLPAELAHRDRTRARQRAHELVEMSHLGGFEKAYPHELSGGMQQRVALARALMNEPRFLLLDEPFGALDALTRERMNLVLAAICSINQVTSLLITHSIEEAVFLSDRVIVLGQRPGKVREVVDVDLPRPRTADVMSDARFTRYEAYLRELLLGDGSLVAAT